MKNPHLDISEQNIEDYHQIEYRGVKYRFNTDIVSILLLGIDQESGSDTQGQSDFIGLLLIDRGKDTFSMLIFPRDSMLDIRYYDFEGNFMGYANDHLSIAYSIGKDEKNGAILVCDAISKLMGGIPINYFTCIYLNQLTTLQDIVGEIELICPNDSLEALNPEWTEGSTILINNSNVETFVRSRDIDVDFSSMMRQERQHVYLEAYLQKLQNSYSAQEAFVETFQKNFLDAITNISLNDCGIYAKMLMNDQLDQITTVPGNNVKGKLYDEYHIDSDRLQDLIIKLYYKEKKNA